MKILLLGSDGMLGSELGRIWGHDAASCPQILHEVVGKDIQDFDITSSNESTYKFCTQQISEYVESARKRSLIWTKGMRP